MNLTDLIACKPPEPWTGAEKIPWNDPDFSRRMLESHLSQDHDWASRRSEIIDRHVVLIADRLPEHARILDLGCGPGFLLLEIQTFEAVKNIGLAPTAWQANSVGIFSDLPHLCLQETFWDKKTETATARHFVVDMVTADVHEYGSSTKAYRDEEIRQMLRDAGFVHVEMLDTDDWPTGSDFEGKLQTYICSR